MTYETLTQLKDKSEADIEKIRQIEVTLQDQVDIIHAMNEKLSVQAENLRQGDNELNRRLVEAERKIIDLQGAGRSAAERAEIVDRIWSQSSRYPQSRLHTPCPKNVHTCFILSK